MEKHRNYFIKDESLQNSDEDFFRHQDLATNLRSMIDNTEAPFNIAIIGKWGLGKSSLINMVLEPMRKDPEHYVVQEINAWKYQKDELCRIFLKKLYQGVSGEKSQFTFEAVKRDYSKIISREISEIEENGIDETKNWWGRYKKFLCVATIILIATMILFSLYSLVNTIYPKGWKNFNLLDFFVRTMLSYCRNIGSIFIIPLLIWMGKIYMDAFVAKSQKKVEVNFPLETRDDYEIYLENKIENLMKKKPNIKIVTVIDDLDRLSVDKIVEALDALKTFMDFKQCIFIVPFDDNILKKAINKEKLEELNKDNENVIESELILDKLFQYKIYLPELIKIDIKEYASKLCMEKCRDFVKEYSNENQMDKVIRNILIHSNVKTPRQVKKILNVFINNIMIARKRENAQKVQSGFATSESGIRMIAKLSVLQADFNDFYDLLFIDAEAMDKLLDIHTGEMKSIDEHLRKYCLEENGQHFIKKEYIPLINYLSNTVKYKVPSILPYLYMAQDKVSVLTGDQIQKDFLAAVESNNMKTVERMLDEIPELAIALRNAIEFNDDVETVMTIIVIAINVFESIAGEYILQIANSIANRCDEMARSLGDIKSEIINYDNLFRVRAEAEDKEAFDTLIKRYIKETIDEKCNIMLKSMLLHEEVLDDEQKNILKNKINEYENQEDRNFEDMVFLVDDLNDNLIIEYLGVDCFEVIAREILEETMFEEKSLRYFKKMFSLFMNKDNINSFQEVWIDMVKYPALHGFINQLFTEEKIAWLDISSSSAMIEIVRGISKDKYNENSYELLSRFPYSIDEDNSEELDEFFSEILTTQHFASIAKFFGEQHSFNYISDTIISLIKNAFENEGYVQDIIELFGYFTSNQEKEYFKTLSFNLQYETNKTYALEKEMIKGLEEETVFQNYVEEICSKVIIVQLNSNYNKSNYFELAIFIIEELGSIICEGTYQEYVDKLMLGYEFFPLEFIKCVRNINKFIDNNQKVKIMRKIMTCEDEQAIDDIAKIVNSNMSLFTKENDNINEPIIFFVNNFEILSDKKIALDFISKRYSKITVASLKNIGDKILKDEMHIEYAAEKLRRFYEELSESDYIQMFIDFIKEEYELVNIEKLMFSHGASFNDIMKIVANDIDAWSHGNITILLDVILDSEEKVEWKNCYIVIITYISKNQDVSENEKALKVLELFIGEKGRNERRQILTLLYQIYNNTASESMKKKIVQQVQAMRGTKIFKTFLSDEEKDEFNLLTK